ncbi:unnamed protein product [Mytilus coruscus]|uniref:Uncharacterized protein n=1 Tax=Mytilus coruscus TaxID=42192 RepID=A0A6J8ED69_MYTCO|nr:unnamed protein product [Mytilus coruscus]
MLESSPCDILWNRCRHLYYRATEKTFVTTNAKSTRDQFCLKSPTVTNTSQTLSSPPSVKLNIKSTSKSHAYCFLCKKPGPKLVVVPPSARCSVFKSNEVLFQKLSKEVVQLTQRKTTGKTDGGCDICIDLKHMLKSNIEDIKAWVEKDDVFVIRWVVESAYARTKQWIYLDHFLPTNQVPHNGNYVCIVYAISSKFSPPVSTGFARHQNLSSFGVRNWGANVCDAAAVVGPIDASESDDYDDEDDETTDVTENEQ